MTIAAEVSDGDNVVTVLDAVARQLEEAGVESARLDARLLVGAATGQSTAGLIAHPERRLTAPESDLLSAMVTRRRAREPIAHILGCREFWSLDFEVSKDVLTPRPDSETLVEAVCQFVPAPERPLRVLDLGTGSGCLLLALLHEFPAATGVGVDISPAAIALARRNAGKLGLATRAAFVVGDWAEPIAGRFDVVTSNPPYIATNEIDDLAPEVAQYEPRGALNGGPDGLDAYRVLVPNLSGLLMAGGVGLFEIGAGQQQAICSLARAEGFEIAGLKADMAGIQRVAILRQA